MINPRHLTFGLLVLAAYWFSAHNGYVFFRDEQRAAPPSVRAGGPTFWGNGFQGGK